MFADAKDIETDFVGEADRLEQFAEVPRGLDGLAGLTIDCGRNETVYADFHMLFSEFRLRVLFQKPREGRANAKEHQNPQHRHENRERKTAWSHQEVKK